MFNRSSYSSSLYNTAAIKQLEELAITQGGISVDTLMQRAGEAAWRALRGEWSHARRITVVCGKGNNAGDGYVVARCAHEDGVEARVVSLVAVAKLKGAALRAAQACIDAGVSVTTLSSDGDDAEIAKVKLLCEEADVVVDALLGTGLKGGLTHLYTTVIRAINAANVPVLAIDVPSGLVANTGAIAAIAAIDAVVGAMCAVTTGAISAAASAVTASIEQEAVRASITVTFIGIKCGLVTAYGPEFCGKIICDDLGIAPEVLARVDACANVLDFAALSESTLLQQPRKRCAHKGDFGHVMVVGGDYGMGGAVRMAAEAAARAGAGLVSVITRPEHVSAINAARPEIMCYGVTRASEVLPLLARVSCVVIGPGLGQSEWSKMLFLEVLRSCGLNELSERSKLNDLGGLNELNGLNEARENKRGKQLVIDADALNLLALFLMRYRECANAALVLTPHPGEAARLLHISAAAVQDNRYAAIADLQRHYGGTIVLKGAGSLIIGAAKNVSVCPYGNPGMASGGMGDVLSGIIGGLLAQRFSAFDAARLAVCAHALAGDMAAQDGGGERGLLALDLLPYVRRLLN